MKGIIVQFRRGRHTVHEKHYLLDLGFNSREEARKLASKEVVWTSPSGKKIKGKISDAHGNKGLVRAIFEKGLPGQAITTEIDIIGLNETKKDEEKDIKKENNLKQLEEQNKQEEKWD